ncbi:hypothetical protein V1478_012701, partial [Vespula squamosa]
MLKSKKGSRYAIIPKSVAKLESVQEGQLAIQYPGCRDGGNDEDAGYGSFRTSLAEHCVIQTASRAHSFRSYHLSYCYTFIDICTWEQMKTLLTIISMPARGTKDALTRIKYYEYHEN